MYLWNEFFGNKHQMATQNINAEMIEGIDLLTNYSGFALADGGYKGIVESSYERQL
jgi:hypothetical protein